MNGARTVSILLFDGVEVLDFAGPFEVFSVTRDLADARTPLFTVELVGTRPGPVRSVGGLSVNPDRTVATYRGSDILLIPGGDGTRPLLRDRPLLDWVRAEATRVELLLSVCTGSLVLAAAGLLSGLEATTYHTALRLLAELEPRCRVRPERRFVDNGRIITSAGISAGIDMALSVVSRLHGAEQARDTAARMEYDLKPDLLVGATASDTARKRLTQPDGEDPPAANRSPAR